MNMKRYIFLLVALTITGFSALAQRPQNLCFRYADRFIAPELLALEGIDSIEFQPESMKRWKVIAGTPFGVNTPYRTEGEYRFGEAERYLLKPNSYSGNDYNSANSTYCFERSRESEHFVVFWGKGLELQSNGDLTGGASNVICNANVLLERAEHIWNTYVDSLGFLMPGSSTTDRYKIQMYVVNQSDWRADGSGIEGTSWTVGATGNLTAVQSKTGMFHCNPWAASIDVTVAHEIGHTFQYLVSADLGMQHGLNYVLGENSVGNEWWEDCANWQAHKCYPSKQFTDNWTNNMNMHHMNIIHEDARYNNCYYQDWWCLQHGLTTIGRVWRESVSPEDPVQAYMRLFGLDEQSFADEQWLGYAHMAAMDIPSWQTYGKNLVGSEKQRLRKVTAAQCTDGLTVNWYIVNPDYCPQNYGYNANPLRVPAANTTVTVQFKGLTSFDGYRSVNPQYAGWRYGIVARKRDGTCIYTEPMSEQEGTLSFKMPEGVTRMWLVVMGAPTTWWTHSWNNTPDDDEQWPYAVFISGSAPI